MMFALGAAGSLLDALQSLTSSKPSATASANPGQGTANPFDLGGSTQSPVTSGFSGKVDGWASISPQTMSALIDAQSQSGTTNTAPTNPQDALRDLFSQIDANGDHSITKSEFENALGAGGTNLAAADNVFGKLDTNGDGSVSLDELKNALQGGHHGGHHHMHAAHSGSSSDSSTDPNSDPLMQALAGASSSAVTNSDGSTTTTITYADGSKVSLTTPAASSNSSTSSSSGSATSSYNWIEQMIQREAKTLSASVASSVSVSA